MKKLNILYFTLFVSFILSEIYVCEAQYGEIVKGLGFVIKIAFKARKHLKKQNKPDEHAVQNKKLDKITTKIESLEKEMVGHFKKLLTQVENVSNVTIHGQIASQFESAMQGVENKLNDLIYKKAKVNAGELVLEKHFSEDVYDLKMKIDGYKDELEIIMRGKNYSHDFLSQVKNLASICEDKMSQVQLLDSFRALYVDTMSRYLIAKHIVISLWETADNKSHADKKRELNSEVRRYLLTYGKRFQELMAQSSREYQHCTTPTSSKSYSIQKYGYEKQKCYITGKGNLSDQIVEFSNYGNGHNGKYCPDYVSLRPTIAKPGYVIVGAKIEHNANIVFIKIMQGKLLPNGIIDPDSIIYNEDPVPGIGDKVFYLHKARSTFDLTKTVANDDRVVTGLGFAVTEDEHIYLDVITQKLDVNNGILIADTLRSEAHQKASTKYPVKNSRQRKDPIIRNDIGLQLVKPNQYVTLHPGQMFRWNPLFDLSDVFPTPLTLLSGASLYVREVYDTQGYLSIRLFTFDIVPHVTEIDFDVNEDFTDVLKNI